MNELYCESCYTGQGPRARMEYQGYVIGNGLPSKERTIFKRWLCPKCLAQKLIEDPERTRKWFGSPEMKGESHAR